MKKNPSHWYDKRKRLFFLRFNLLLAGFGFANLTFSVLNQESKSFTEIAVQFILLAHLVVTASVAMNYLKYRYFKVSALVMIGCVLPFLWFRSDYTELHFYWGVVVIAAIGYFYHLLVAILSGCYFFGIWSYLKITQQPKEAFVLDEFVDISFAIVIFIIGSHYLNKSIAKIIYEYNEKETQLLQMAYTTSVEREEELELEIERLNEKVSSLEKSS